MLKPIPTSRVLLVDCFPDERQMYDEYLRFAGFDPVDLCEPSVAFDEAVRLQPEVVVADMVLTEGTESGLEFVRRLRRDERTRDAAIVMVSGHVFPRDRFKAMRAGCDVFLSKPCLPETLVAGIQRAVSQRRVPAP